MRLHAVIMWFHSIRAKKTASELAKIKARLSEIPGAITDHSKSITDRKKMICRLTFEKCSMERDALTQTMVDSYKDEIKHRQHLISNLEQEQASLVLRESKLISTCAVAPMQLNTASA